MYSNDSKSAVNKHHVVFRDHCGFLEPRFPNIKGSSIVRIQRVALCFLIFLSFSCFQTVAQAQTNSEVFPDRGLADRGLAAVGVGSLTLQSFESFIKKELSNAQIPSRLVKETWLEVPFDMYKFYCNQTSFNYDVHGIKIPKNDKVYHVQFKGLPFVNEDFSVYKTDDTFLLRYNKIKQITISDSKYVKNIDDLLTDLKIKLFQNQAFHVTCTYRMNLEELAERIQAFNADYQFVKSILTPSKAEGTPNQVNLLWQLGPYSISVSISETAYNHLKDMDPYLDSIAYYHIPVEVNYQWDKGNQSQDLYKSQAQRSLRNYLEQYIIKITSQW